MSDKQLRVLVTGPESSGTTYVSQFLAHAGFDVLHRSQPNGTDWLDLVAMLGNPASGRDAPTKPVDRVVVVVRGAQAHIGSQIRRNIESYGKYAVDRRTRSLQAIAPLLSLGDPRVLLVTYESLEAEAERIFLLQWLGVNDTPDMSPVPFHNQNGKYYS